LILLILQYQNNLTPFLQLTVKIDQIIACYSQSQTRNNLVSIVQQFCRVVRLKLILHGAHQNLQGNLYINLVDDSFPSDLKSYLNSLYQSVKNIFQTVLNSVNSSFSIYMQPLFNELCHAYQQFLNLFPNQTLDKIISLLDESKKFPYLEGSVDYPGVNFINITPLFNY
jgi:hypothetical protein